MKKCLAVFIITFMMIAVGSTDSRAFGPCEPVIQFFEASKNGDVETMKQLIAGPFYKNRIVLIEMNKDYPEFLKKFYDGASMSILRHDIGNRDMIVTGHHRLFEKFQSAPSLENENKLTDKLNGVAVVIMELQFRDGSKIKYKYLLQMTNNSIWKIYDEILITE